MTTKGRRCARGPGQKRRRNRRFLYRPFSFFCPAFCAQLPDTTANKLLLGQPLRLAVRGESCGPDHSMAKSSSPEGSSMSCRGDSRTAPTGPRPGMNAPRELAGRERICRDAPPGRLYGSGGWLFPRRGMRVVFGAGRPVRTTGTGSGRAIIPVQSPFDRVEAEIAPHMCQVLMLADDVVVVTALPGEGGEDLRHVPGERGPS